jgi:hypothetical protein
MSVKALALWVAFTVHLWGATYVLWEVPRPEWADIPATLTAVGIGYALLLAAFAETCRWRR